MKTNLLAALFLASTCCLLAEDAVEIKIANPGFEQANKDGICYAWNKNAEVCFDNPQAGEACAKQKSNGTNWDAILHIPVFPAEPKTKYRITVWNRNTLSAGSAKYGIRFVDAKQETLPNGYLWRSVRKGENKWTEYKFEFTTPEGTAFLNLYFMVNKPQGDIFWDSVKIEKIIPNEKE